MLNFAFNEPAECDVQMCSASTFRNAQRLELNTLGCEMTFFKLRCYRSL